MSVWDTGFETSVVTFHPPPEVSVSRLRSRPSHSTIHVQPAKEQLTPIEAPLASVHVEPTHVASAEETTAGGLPPVQIVYENVNFTIDIKKPKNVVEHRQILSNCSGVFNPGRLTAVMGASGAGKTSLMNIVSGNPTLGTMTGSVKLNGVEVFDSPIRIRELSAYIQQDDLLLGTQTVKEAVTLSAKLRLPKSMPLEEKLRRVDHVIEMLGLTKCANTIIGDTFNKGISGGEKRRVSMALELIKAPAVLFLDEPTSGLDTFTSYAIIALLREIAHTQGKTIVVTIHQPSSDIWHMFDDLCLLADGRTMYHGPAEHVVDYFAARGLVCPENFNPADFLFMKVLNSMEEQLRMISADMQASASSQKKTDLAHMTETAAMVTERDAENARAYEAMQAAEKKRVTALLDDWLQSSEYATLAKQVAAPRTTPLPDPSAIRAERPSEWYAFALLSQRRWFDLLRDKMKLRIQLFQYLFFAVMLGLIFLQLGHDQNSIQDREGSLFFIAVQAMFMSFLSNLNTFGPEKIVMQREMEGGLYALPSYFFSRWIIELPFRVLFPFIYSCIIYWMVGYAGTGEQFILFAIALILIDASGTNLSIMMCSMFPDVHQVMQAGPAIIMPLMVFSGFYVKLHSLGWWFRWIAYISPIRYGYCAVLKNEMEGLEFECDDSSRACTPTGEAAIELLGLEDDPARGINLIIMIGLAAGFLIGAFLILKLTMKKK